LLIQLHQLLVVDVAADETRNGSEKVRNEIIFFCIKCITVTHTRNQQLLHILNYINYGSYGRIGKFVPFNEVFPGKPLTYIIKIKSKQVPSN